MINYSLYESTQALKEMILNEITTFDETSITLKLDELIAEKINLSLSEKKELKTHVLNTLFKYDIIQPLLDDDSITEIMINGPNNIYIEKEGVLQKTEICFENQMHLMQLIDKIAMEIDRPINLSSPILDARLKDGSRVNVVLDNICKHGPVMTIRKFLNQFQSLDALIENETLSKEAADFIAALIRAKYNLFISGGTGTGKTTLLNCISTHIPHNERLITIEDARELNLRSHKNLISMETRHNLNTIDINISTLIKTSLRMRPDRIIVGEVRGQEVIDMLQAMNTGHDGSMSTGHGNTPFDMLLRLEGIATANSQLPSQLIRKQIVSAIDFLIHVERFEDGKRRVSKITEIDKDCSEYNLINHYDLMEKALPNIHNIKHKRKWNRYAKFSSRV